VSERGEKSLETREAHAKEREIPERKICKKMQRKKNAKERGERLERPPPREERCIT